MLPKMYVGLKKKKTHLCVLLQRTNGHACGSDDLVSRAESMLEQRRHRSGNTPGC